MKVQVEEADVQSGALTQMIFIIFLGPALLPRAGAETFSGLTSH